MAIVDTVKGEISSNDLGFTYIHEHLLTLPPLWRIQQDPDMALESVEKITNELKLFQAAGGKSLLEATCIDYGRNVTGIMEAAKHVDVNIMMTTGFNRGDYRPELIEDKSISEIEDILTKDIVEGIDNTPVKASMIKFGTSNNVILPVEEKVAKAVGRVQKNIGVPVLTHTTLGTMALEQLDLLEKTGADLTKVTICHFDQNLDPYLHRKVAERGANIMFDGVGKTKYAPDSARIECLNKLIDAGFKEQLFVSGDMARQSYFKSYGGGPGFEFLLKTFVPRLKDEGWDQDLIDQIFVKNPMKFLSYR